MTFEDRDYTTTCITCKRAFTEDDGSEEYFLKVTRNEAVECCCDEGTLTQNGKTLGHSKGVCTHCCPLHGEVSEPDHDPETCGICTNDGEYD